MTYVLIEKAEFPINTHFVIDLTNHGKYTANLIYLRRDPIYPYDNYFCMSQNER